MSLCVRDVMTRSVEVAHLHEPLPALRDRMRASGVTALPVVDGDRLVGMVTVDDIRRRVLEGGLAPEATHVRDVFTPEVHSCMASQSVEEAAAIMRSAGVRRLPVVDDDLELCGMLAHDDLPDWARAPLDADACEPRGVDDEGDPHPRLRVYAAKPKLKQPAGSGGGGET